MLEFCYRIVLSPCSFSKITFRALWHTIYIPVTKPLLVVNKTWGDGDLFQSLLRLSTVWHDPWSMVVIQTTCINFLGLRYKLQQTWWLKKEFIFSQVQRPRSLLRRCQQSWLLVEVLREGSFHLFLSFWGVLVVLGVLCGCLPVFATIFPWPLPLSLYVFFSLL